MKKRLIAYLESMACIILVGAMTACLDEHTEPVDTTLRVGNVYCGDGIVCPVDWYMDSGRTDAAGVVVAVGTENDNWRALIMALEDAGTAYYQNDVQIKVEGVSTEIAVVDGKQNTAALITAAAKDENFHPAGALLAAAYSAGGIQGWHLPSVQEFRLALTGKAGIQHTLSALHAEPFHHDWYLTSTVDDSSDETGKLYNFCIILPEGRVASDSKTAVHYVRPFLILR